MAHSIEFNRRQLQTGTSITARVRTVVTHGGRVVPAGFAIVNDVLYQLVEMPDWPLVFSMLR